VIGVGEYAQKLAVPVTKVITELMRNGVMATINEQIDFDTAAIIGADLGFEIVPEQAAEPEAISTPKLAEGEGISRPPVVAVMGHVDHGKTKLLDAIRSTNVIEGESGGITQHIGAYQIKRNDRWITFLDTPGHEAFSALRAHGAKMTDVAIIVVAADDGVKPQTKEAIQHARDAGVKMVIAINKIDKEGADPNRVKQQLSELGLVPEDWGGDVVTVEVSAKAGENIDKLLDLVLLVADLENLRTKAEGPSDGVVIESHLETGRGPVASVLVNNGVLNVGDYVVAGGTYAKVRSLEDYRGKKIKQASGGMPAQITGFKDVPAFGDVWQEVDNEQAARSAALSAKRTESIKSMTKVKKIGLEELSTAITAGQVKELNVVIKADVQGSLESLTSSINALRNDEVGVKIISSGIGDITESDITLTKASTAILLGFNVTVSSNVRQLATREQVEIRIYKVIYELLDDLRASLSQMLAPEIIEHAQGVLKVLGVFKTTKSAVICGGEVTAGKIEPKLQVKILRGLEEMGRGTIASLQKEKQAAKEVVQGEQCGMEIVTAAKIAVGDTLEFFTTETRARKL
jgi:translation initiation factor IF-2